MKFILFAGMALLLACLCMVWLGYCPLRNGFINESEARESAAKYAMGLTQVYLQQSSRFVIPNRPVPYKSLAEFARENPNCCTQPHTAMSFAEIFEKLTGRSFARFHVRHKVRFVDDAGHVQTNEQLVYVRVTNCAEAYSAL